MLITLIGLAPVLFVLWCVVKTIEIMVRFISFDIKLASIKHSNPELYRKMRYEAYRRTNGDKTALAMWISHRH